MSGRALTLTATCLACAASISTAAAATGASSSAPPAASVVIVGGTRAQRHLARLTAIRVAGVTLSRVVFQSPSRALRNMHVRGIELVVTSSGKESSRSDWEQQLYVGTYLGLMARWPQATVAAVGTAHTEGAVGPLADPRPFLRPYEVFGSNPSTRKVARFRERLVNAVALARASIVELRTIATPARAIALTVRVSDPAAFLKHRAKALLDLLNFPSIPLLGYYLAAEDSSGHLFWATSQLPGTGSVYTVPSLEACGPVAHGDAFGFNPPPCPAS